MAAERIDLNPLAAPLLATRFFVPQSPATSVPRPRLTDRLKHSGQVPLTLISAPPGFGKSSLVSQWIHSQAGIRIAWLSLEPADQEWSLFFRYLVAAWQRVFPHVGKAAVERLNDPPPLKKELLLNLLLNDLLAALNGAGVDQALLVLDDYHRIETEAIHETIAYLVEHLPPRCHLILLTRADPPLPIARWRSRGLLLELRADDLRFTLAESVEYLDRSLRLGLTEAQVRLLCERTEGWIVGLQMAALSLQGHQAAGKNVQEFLREFDGSNRFVLDYLIEEVFCCQPEEVQRFLVVTALFKQFCGPLCDALLDTRPPYAQHMLERLEKTNLFLIPLDDHRHWFRYHHLFAELLFAHLQQIDPGQIPALCRRGADWFSHNGLWRDAIHYALQTKDLDFSADVFEQAILKGGLDFLYSRIKPLIDPFPLQVVQDRPLLSLAKAIVILESSQLAGTGIEALLRSAEKGILQAPPFPGQEDVLGWLYMVQSDAATLLGDYTWMIEANQQVPRWIPKDFLTNVEALVQFGYSAYFAGDLNETEMYWQQALDLSTAYDNTYYILALLNGVARTLYQKGELIRAEKLFRQALRLLEEHPGQFLRWLGAMQRDYADLLRDGNRLEEARALITTAIPLLEKWHTISALGFGFFSAARIQLACGDLPGAHDMLDKVDDLQRRYTLYPDLETLAQMTRARVYLEEGKTDRAWQILETRLNSIDRQHAFQREWLLIVQARILVRTRCPADALTLLAGWREKAKANGRGRNWLSIGLIEALAHHALGDRQKAFHLLNDGLAFAQAHGQQRALLDEGELMRALLEGFRIQFPNSPFRDYLAEILSIFPALPKSVSETSLHIEGVYESLSRRELEILRLICQGLSNQEIADRLVLSVGTVKFHIHNIFGKLGVRDRPQAIAKSGLLSSETTASWTAPAKP